MGRRAAMTELRRAILSALYLGELSHTKIAEKYGVKLSLVKNLSRTMYREGCEDREDDTSMEEIERLIALRLPTMPKEPRHPQQYDHVPHALARGRGLKAMRDRER